jgi:hypothetical protein
MYAGWLPVLDPRKTQIESIMLFYPVKKDE